MVMPGDNVEIQGELIVPIAMEEGMRFAIREGGTYNRCGNNYENSRLRLFLKRPLEKGVSSKYVTKEVLQGCVAQLVEQRSPKSLVGGSNPSALDRKNINLRISDGSSGG
jgi:hypothetical protein